MTLLVLMFLDIFVSVDRVNSGVSWPGTLRVRIGTLTADTPGAGRVNDPRRVGADDP